MLSPGHQPLPDLHGFPRILPVSRVWSCTERSALISYRALRDVLRLLWQRQRQVGVRRQNQVDLRSIHGEGCPVVGMRKRPQRWVELRLATIVAQQPEECCLL